ncbi:MAG: phosphate/phosphite/phosphonate ABC transporter substrate-binding protein [Reichenbachiella sp.]
MKDLFLLCFILSLTISCTSTQKPNPTAEKHATSDTLDFYFSPTMEASLLALEADSFQKFIKQKTGINIQVIISGSYEELISAFDNQKADFALMNSSGYVAVNQKFGSKAMLQAVRYGQPNYYGQIIANVNSGIKSIKDIEGKSIAYTDLNSTSGYLFPKSMLENQSVKTSNVVFAGAHENVVRMVYEGTVDAGASYYSKPAEDGTIRDARSRLIKDYPDISEKVKIIQITDPIPNDPIVFAKHISKSISDQLSQAIISYTQTKEGQNLMQDFYAIEGYVHCDDQDYEKFKKVISLN